MACIMFFDKKYVRLYHKNGSKVRHGFGEKLTRLGPSAESRAPNVKKQERPIFHFRKIGKIIRPDAGWGQVSDFLNSSCYLHLIQF